MWSPSRMWKSADRNSNPMLRRGDPAEVPRIGEEPEHLVDRTRDGLARSEDVGAHRFVSYVSALYKVCHGG